MTELMERLKRHVTEAGFRFVEVEKENAMVLVHEGDNSVYKLYIKDYSPRPVLMMQAECPVKIQENRKRSMSELLHRMNYGRLIGNMEFNYDEGTISYKVSVDYTGIKTYSDELFTRMIAASLGQLDKFMEDILAFTYGDEDVLVENTVTIPGAMKITPRRFNRN